MNINPHNKNILLKAILNKPISNGGIELPDGYSTDTRLYEIVDVGNKADPKLFRIGDKVIITTGVNIRIGKQNFVVTTQDNVIATVEE